MNENNFDYEEFFISESQEEIDNERNKKHALMSIFPKRLGCVDHTRYVLLNNDKEKQESNSGRTGTGYVQASHLPAPEDNSNPFNFDTKENKQPTGGNDWFCLNEPKSQASGDTIAQLANSKQLRASKTITKTGANNPKIDSSKAYSQPDYIWNTNREHSTGIGANMEEANDTKLSKETLKLRYFPTGEEYTHQINELKAKLPKGVLNVLNELGTEIIVGHDLHTLDKDNVRTDRNGIYNLNKITIDSKHINFETLFAEALHAVQDYLGILGHSNAEFQEHIAKDIYFRHIDEPHAISTTWDENQKFSNFINNSFANENYDTIDINTFSTEVLNQIEDFKERYKDYPKYSSNFKDDFNYNWIDLFKILDIPLKIE